MRSLTEPQGGGTIQSQSIQTMQAKPQRTADAAVASMRRLVEAFVYAYNKGKASEIASLMTEGALLMPPEEDTIVGKEGIAARFGVFFDGFSFEMELTPQDTYMVGNLGFERGQYAAFAVPKEGGRPGGGYGEYRFRFEESFGSWRISAFGTAAAAKTPAKLQEDGRVSASDATDWHYKWTGTLAGHFGDTFPAHLVDKL